MTWNLPISASHYLPFHLLLLYVVLLSCISYVLPYQCAFSLWLGNGNVDWTTRPFCKGLGKDHPKYPHVLAKGEWQMEGKDSRNKSSNFTSCWAHSSLKEGLLTLQSLAKLPSMFCWDRLESPRINCSKTLSSIHMALLTLTAPSFVTPGPVIS